MSKIAAWIAGSAALVLGAVPGVAATILYEQNFENPVGYFNGGGDVDISSVNGHYGNQPAGFTFAQQYTVETLNVTGSARGSGGAAFGTGWSDPTGKGGNFALGMLSSAQNDLLGLSFDIGAFRFLNVSVDVSSIDLSTFGGPFVPIDVNGIGSVAPKFRFTLLDNPTGILSTGVGLTELAFVEVTGTKSKRIDFDWTSALFGLDAKSATNGNVILQVDLLDGGYAALDNIRIAAADLPGVIDPPSAIPLPGAAPLLLSGVALLGWFRRRRAA